MWISKGGSKLSCVNSFWFHFLDPDSPLEYYQINSTGVFVNDKFKVGKGNKFNLTASSTNSHLLQVFVLGCEKSIGHLFLKDMVLPFKMIQHILDNYEAELVNKFMLSEMRKVYSFPTDPFWPCTQTPCGGDMRFYYNDIILSYLSWGVRSIIIIIMFPYP